MARQRFIHPGIWSDPAFGSLGDAEQLMFIGLFSNADDEGRILAGPAYIKSVVWPHRNMPLAKVKTARDNMLKALPSVALYTVANVEYIAFLKWSEYQKPKYPTQSKLPPMPEKISGTVPEGVPEPSGSLPPTVLPRARADLGLGLDLGLGEEAVASSAPGRIDHHWEATVTIYGKVTNQRERHSRNSALPSLKESLNGTPVENFVSEMTWRKELFERLWQKPCSLHALVKHWSEADLLRDFKPPPETARSSFVEDNRRAAAEAMMMLGHSPNGTYDLELEAGDD